MMPGFRSRRKTITPMFYLLLSSAYTEPRTFCFSCRLASKEAWGSQKARRGHCHTADLNSPKGCFSPWGIILNDTGRSRLGGGSAVEWASWKSFVLCFFPTKLPLTPTFLPPPLPCHDFLIPPKGGLNKQLCCACQVKPQRQIKICFACTSLKTKQNISLRTHYYTYQLPINRVHSI